jgi:ribosome-associated protein
LEQLTVLATRKRSVARITKNSKLFKTIIQAIQEKKGENIVSLDLRKIHEAVADFFIICEAKNHVQVRAIADFVEDQVEKNCEELPYKHEGMQALQWALIDYVNVVVHIMQSESRNFYKLEDMWNDAEREEHED